MRFRKLRIAWSVGWGLVAVLLIALWVRSYWKTDAVLQWDKSPQFTAIIPHGALFTTIISDSGVISLAIHLPRNGTMVWEYRSDNTIATRSRKRKSFVWLSNSMGNCYMAAPTYVFVCMASAITAAPWIRSLRWRFSLRTLLIATTLVAVVLGLIVYASR